MDKTEIVTGLSMKRIIGILVLVFVISLLVTAPARVIVSFLPKTASVKLAGIEGSIWNGRVANLSIKRESYSNINWTLNPLLLLTGKLGGQFTLDESRVDASGEWRAGFDSTVSVLNASFATPANELAPMLPYKGVALEGDIRLEVEQASFNETTGPSGVIAQAYWANSAVGLTGNPVGLGNFVLDIASNDEQAIIITAKPSANQIDLRGQATMIWNKEVALNFTVKEDVPQSLRSATNFLKKTPDKRRALEMKVPLNRRR